MQDSLSTDDIKTLVSIAGRQGAIAALESGTKHKLQQLSEFAKKNNIDAGQKATKKTLSSAIVRHVDKRIQKSLDELKGMSKEELISYFKEVDSDQADLLDLLSTIDLKAQVKTKSALMEFAAIQIQSLGVFERLSNGKSKEGQT
ncbi:MAG: hypothetical protein GY862_18295 [Gammaproteobacteria bacterium]|nr:hypothetical protein [Gammaproteobacteria bacterium]